MAKLVNILGIVITTFTRRNEPNFTHTRLFTNIVIKSVKQGHGTDKRNQISKLGTISILQELLQINKLSAMEIAANYKPLRRISSELIKKNYEICKSVGFSNNLIIRCPYLLVEKDLAEKLHILRQMPGNIEPIVGLVKMKKEKLYDTMDNFKQSGNRVTYFAKLLNVSPTEMCEQIIQRPFLQKISLNKATEAVRLLNEHGITGREILNDLWALNYSKKTIESKIKFAKENNLDKIKTWMIRAQPNIFLNYIKIRSDNKLILGNNSLTEYLSNRLECSVEHANFIVTRLPALKTKSVKKMEEIIDFLYDQGFKPSQITVMPKILLHSIDTMKKRVAELQQLCVEIENLNVLTKTQKRYEGYIKKYLKKKKLESIT